MTNSIMQNMIAGTEKLYEERQAIEKEMQDEQEKQDLEIAEEAKVKQAAEDLQLAENMTDSQKIELLTKAVMDLTTKHGGTK